MKPDTPIPSQWRNVLNVALEVLSDLPSTSLRSRESLQFIIATASAEMEAARQIKLAHLQLEDAP
jgi:hypothetical protein